jgi:hypothetical protein
MGRWLLCCAVLAACSGRRSPWTLSRGLAAERFPAPTEQVAAGSRAGTARNSVDRFIREALDEEPLRKRLRSARAPHFDGGKGTQRSMHTTWHHVLFDRATQIDVSENSLRLNRSPEAMVKRCGRRIAR